MLNRSTLLLLIALLTGVVGCTDAVSGPMLPAKWMFSVLLILYLVSVGCSIRKIRSASG